MNPSDAVAWSVLVEAEPDFAREVENRFNKYIHKVIATLRKDGSPRVSGIEAEFRNGHLWLGMMPGSAKAMDLRRDPRMALHSGTEDPEEKPTPGTTFDAKVSGFAVEVYGDGDQQGPAPPGEPHRFRIEVIEVVLVGLGDPGDRLLIRMWSPMHGLREVERR